MSPVDCEPGLVCIDGVCQAPDASGGGTGASTAVGCADGEREGYVDASRFPDIAACAGPAGGLDLRAAPIGIPCGDDVTSSVPGPVPVQCLSAGDFCARGWHVCMRSGDADEIPSLIDDEDCLGDVAGRGTFVAAASHCSAIGANGGTCEYREPLPCSTRGACAEPVCCGTDCAFGMCVDGVYPAGTATVPDTNFGCANVNPAVTGVLCCRD
jgi:hypothetical protein